MSQAQLPPQDQASDSTPPHSLSSALLHDLRTPLNQIIGYSEMLEEQAEEEGRDAEAGDLHKVRTAGRQLLELINNSFLPIKAPAQNVAPLSALATPPISVATEEEIGEATPEPLSSGESQGLLLVVDDNETNRDVLSRRLERQGYAVATAQGGTEALHMVRSRTFDLVLLDIMMPEMDGYETLRQLKADPGLRHIPVIMISALNELDSVVRCIEMGAEDYLSKPFNPTLLKARVGACLDKKRGHDRERRLFAQLQENYGRLQEAEKMRDDLTHMIVHDLRTPLSSLLIGLQLMANLAPIDPAQVECYNIAVRGGQTLLSLINDLLDISKMESGTFALELAPLSVPALVESSLEQVASSISDKQLTLVLQIEPSLPLLRGDEDKLRRVLVNLLGNALKFTLPNGSICVATCLETGESTSNMLFSVSDTGEGIPPAAFVRIFEKFGQVESHRSGRQTSTGLGLTFCKMAVEAHGGRIWVESTLGQGSTFFFSIPL